MSLEFGTNIVVMGQAAMPEDPLPYRVEIWEGDGAAERLVGRAASIALARAIFAAAQSDYAGYRVVLSRGSETLSDILAHDSEVSGNQTKPVPR